MGTNRKNKQVTASAARRGFLKNTALLGGFAGLSATGAASFANAIRTDMIVAFVFPRKAD